MSNLLTTFVQSIASRIIRSEDTLTGDKLNIKSRLNPQDSQFFENLCQFLWVQGNPLPLIFDVENEVYAQQGITPATLKRLEAIGLIIFDSYGFVKKGFGKHTRLFYCGRPTKIGFQNNENNHLDLGHVLLTEQGKKLASTYKTSRNQQFYEYVINRWFQQGLVVSSIQINGNRKTDSNGRTCSIKERG